MHFICPVCCSSVLWSFQKKKLLSVTNNNCRRAGGSVGAAVVALMSHSGRSRIDAVTCNWKELIFIVLRKENRKKAWKNAKEVQRPSLLGNFFSEFFVFFWYKIILKKNYLVLFLNAFHGKENWKWYASWIDNIQQIADAVQKRSITNCSGERPAR